MSGFQFAPASTAKQNGMDHFELTINYVDAQVTGIFIPSGKSCSLQVETSIDGHVVHRTAPGTFCHNQSAASADAAQDDVRSISSLQQLSAGNSISKVFETLQPPTPIIVSFALYKKRWTKEGYKLIGNVQFPITNLLSILDKGPVKGPVSLIPYRKNLTLRGKIIVALQLSSRTSSSSSSSCGENATESDSMSTVSDEEHLSINDGYSDEETTHIKAQLKTPRKSISKRIKNAMRRKHCVLCPLQHLMAKGHFPKTFRRFRSHDEVQEADEDAHEMDILSDQRAGSSGLTDEEIAAMGCRSNDSEDSLISTMQQPQPQSQPYLTAATTTAVSSTAAVVGSTTVATAQCVRCPLVSSFYYKILLTILVAAACAAYLKVLDMAAI